MNSDSSEKWLYSVWLKDTRYYGLELCQDLFGNWIVQSTWGRYQSYGAGQSRSTVCKDYQQALVVYQQEQARRIKRGYVLQQDNSQIE